MALYTNTNVSSLTGANNLRKATKSLDTTYQRLSSGLRINSAKDDAAGLQIADRLTSQINGYNQGNRNANDGIAICQTVEGALDETTSMLQRIRTLAVQAANGSNTSDDRDSIQKEVDQLCAEMTRIACETTYAGKAGLNGNGGTRASLLVSGEITFHVGANQGDTVKLGLSAGFTTDQMQVAGAGTAGGAGTGLSSGSLALRNSPPADQVGTYKSLAVDTRSAAEVTITACDSMLKYVDGKRADLGAMQNRLESTINNQTNVSLNQADARSRIRDTDFAEESSNLSQQSIIQQAASSMLTQANSRPQIALSLLG